MHAGAIEVEVVLGTEVHHVATLRQWDLRDHLVQHAAPVGRPLERGRVVGIREVESDLPEHL